jgi:CO/xanthine dehydrogenase Mo-binding subunit
VSDGRVETLSLADYKLPTIADVPPLEQRLITGAPGNGPYGAKAVGELTNQLLPPAIANAVFDAVGVWITDLPVTAENVYRALRTR